MAARPLTNRIQSLGLTDDRHLLFYAPRDYVDYSIIHTKIPFGVPGFVCLKLKVETRPEWKTNNTPRMVFAVSDECGIKANIVAFGDKFTWRYATPGDEIHVRAKIRIFNGEPQLDQAQKIPKEFEGGLMPCYKAKKGVIAEHTLRSGIFEMLTRNGLDYAAELVLRELQGMSSDGVLQKCIDPRFKTIQEAIRAMHKPSSQEEAAAALKSIKLLAAMHVISNARKNAQRPSVTGAGMHIDGESLKSIISTLPYTMTGDQKLAAREIIIDLRRDLPMSRLLSCDVGTGKTVVFLIAAMAAQRAGLNAVILAPNGPLAKQIVDEIHTLWPKAPVELVTTSSKPNLGKYCASPIKPVLVGTTALITKAANWHVHLLIIDEQQKLSREQRAKLAGPGTHVLEATATCIPPYVSTGQPWRHGYLNAQPVSD